MGFQVVRIVILRVVQYSKTAVLRMFYRLIALSGRCRSDPSGHPNGTQMDAFCLCFAVFLRSGGAVLGGPSGHPFGIQFSDHIDPPSILKQRIGALGNTRM